MRKFGVMRMSLRYFMKCSWKNLTIKLCYAFMAEMTFINVILKFILATEIIYLIFYVMANYFRG